MKKNLTSWATLLLLLVGRGPDSRTTGAEPATAALNSPRSGARWAVGSRHQVRWDHGNDPGGMARVELSRDGGATWTTIAGAVPDNGRLDWEVPAGPGDVTLRVVTKAAERASRFAIIGSQARPEYRWVRVTGRAQFAPRDGAGALVYRGRMWFLGGWNPGDRVHFPRICNNEVWSSGDGASWTLVKPNTFKAGAPAPADDWEGRHTAGYAVFRDRMWIVGGDANQGHYQDDVWSSDDGVRWRKMNRDGPVPWSPRVLHHTLVFDGDLWVIGGQTIPQIAEAPEAFLRDIWRSPDGVNWRKVAPMEPYFSARGMIGGSAVMGGRIWILGGGTYDTPRTPARRFFNDVWSSSDGVHWRQDEDAAPWEPRQYHDVAAFDGRLWVLEGYSGVNRNDVWYSSDGVNWYEVPKTPWAARHAASIYAFGGALWVVAGNNMEPDVWKLVGAGRKEPVDPTPP